MRFFLFRLRWILLATLPACAVLAGAAFADGMVEDWVRLYHDNSTDIAKSLAIDADGDIIVFGSNDGGAFIGFTAVKYNDAGIRQWVAKHREFATADLDLGAAMTLDDEGNVYVAGGHCAQVGPSGCIFSEFLTIKYDAAGNEQWRAQYNGPLNIGGFASDVAVDANGHVAVTGTVCVTTNLQGQCINYDAATLVYNADGVELWAERYDGAGNEEGHRVAFDNDGNIIVFGLAHVALQGTDLAVIKYEPDGDLRWDVLYNGPGDGDEIVGDLFVDNADNIYAVGGVCTEKTLNECDNYDFVALKFEPSAYMAFDAYFDGSGQAHDIARAAFLDAQGNVVVVGETLETVSQSYDYGVVKFAGDGYPQWANEYGDPDGQDDFAVDVVVDEQGMIYVAGHACVDGGASGCNNMDMVVAAFDQTGDQQFLLTYDGAAGADDLAAALALDDEGNLYLAGASCKAALRGDCSNYDFAVIKYIPSGGDDDDNDNDDDDTFTPDDDDNDDNNDDNDDDDDDDDNDDDDNSFTPDDDGGSDDGDTVNHGGGCGCQA